MARLTENQAMEFQRLFKELFGEDISLKEAYEQGSSLILLLEKAIQYAELNMNNKAA